MASMSKCVQFCTTAREGLCVIAAAVVWFFVLICLKELWLAANTQEAMTEMLLMCQRKQDQLLLRAPQTERVAQGWHEWHDHKDFGNAAWGPAPHPLKRVGETTAPELSGSTCRHRPLWAVPNHSLTAIKVVPLWLQPCQRSLSVDPPAELGNLILSNQPRRGLIYIHKTATRQSQVKS